MRISDWSSDVCSSDLEGVALRQAVDGDGVEAVVHAGHGDRARRLVGDLDAGIEAGDVVHRATALRGEFQLAPADRSTDALVVRVERIEHARGGDGYRLQRRCVAAEPRVEIGSAWCRERVCQYV